MKTQSIVDGILEKFQGFRMPELPTDEYLTIGKERLANKMLPYVEKGEPIKFVMLGYPMKSTNDKHKVIGKLPDLAEQVSLENFATFNSAIKEIYNPGVDITIANDGLIFSELLEVEDRVVFDYGDVSQEMARNAGAPMNWVDLRTFYGNNVSTAREKLNKQFGLTESQLEQRILFDQDTNYLYRGMIRFMSEELRIKPYQSGNQLHKKAKAVARQMMLWNEAYSNLVKKEFADHVRLSMHPSLNNGNKYSFQLIPSPKAWTSPWHCALLIEKDGTISTVHREDAESKGHELVFEQGRPYYFQEI